MLIWVSVMLLLLSVFEGGAFSVGLFSIYAVAVVVTGASAPVTTTADMAVAVTVSSISAASDIIVNACHCWCYK